MLRCLSITTLEDPSRHNSAQSHSEARSCCVVNGMDLVKLRAVKDGNKSTDVKSRAFDVQACFAEFAKREVEMCGEWAVFYHSYSFAALIYEVAVVRALALASSP
eukprot:5060951-Amphidinium_carterae.1